MASSPESVSDLLAECRSGDPLAIRRLVPIVYSELRAIAAAALRRERPNHTLQPTALVHEAFLRLVDQRDVHWQNRAHFLGCAAQVMRHILVDHARAHRAEKRGGGAERVTLDDSLVATGVREVDVLALDEALRVLGDLNERQSRVVELRYFGGLTIEETAELLGVSTATVSNDWTIARAWLRRELGGGGGR